MWNFIQELISLCIKQEYLFVNIFPAGATHSYRDDLFDQMLKYRYIEYHMFLYIERNYDHLWISMNGSDNFTMASRK
jgi:hypothetical protein